MRRPSRFIAFLMAMVMAFTLLPTVAFAATDPLTLRISSETAAPGKEIQVKLSLENNPGIASVKVKVGFGSELTLTNVEFNSAELGGTSTLPQKLTSPVTLSWIRPTQGNYYDDSLFAILTFTVNSDAIGVGENEKNVKITATYDQDNVYDETEKNVPMTVIDGQVKITNYIAGDINGDGVCNQKDLTRLFQHYADWDVWVNRPVMDVNGDGSLNQKDLTRLCQYFADWDVEIFAMPGYWQTEDCEHTSLTLQKAKAATCVSEGNIAYYKCDDCGQLFEDAAAITPIALNETITPIDANNHPEDKIQIIPAVEPTATKEGSTEGSKCTACGTFINEPQPIPIPDNEYAILYNIVGSDTYLASLEIKNPNETSYSGKSDVVLKDLAVVGYDFKGWLDEDGNKISKIPAGTNRTITLTANLTPTKYKVQFKTSMIKDEDRNKLVINPHALSETEKMQYTTNEAWVLPTIRMDTYYFVGWSDQNGNFYTNFEIPKGTTGNLILTENWISQRNRAVPVNDYGDPIVVEDTVDHRIYFTYEIGTIQNVPLYTTKYLNVANGLIVLMSETEQKSTTEENMKSLTENIAKETTDSTQFTLSEEYNETTDISEKYSTENGYDREQVREQSKSQTNTQAVSMSTGGSSETYEYNDKLTKEAENKSFVINTNFDTGISNELKTGIKNTNEISAGVSFPIDIIKLNAGVKNTTEVYAENDLKTYADFGVDTSSSWNKDTYEENYSANSQTDVKTWNASSSASSSESIATKNIVSEATHETIAKEQGYGKTYSNSKGNSSTRGTTSGTTEESGSTTTYVWNTSENHTTTWEVRSAGDTHGDYRMVMAGTLHVFATVVYDIAAKEYYVRTFTVCGDGSYSKNGISDAPREILDYSYDRTFSDWENTVLPFEIPVYVNEYVDSRITKTVKNKTVKNGAVVFDEAFDFDFDNKNRTATVCGYDGTDKVVYVPSYYIDAEGNSFRVTGISKAAFRGNTDIVAVSLSRFISVIPDSAFEGCTSLENVVAPGLKVIGSNAFKNCSALKEYTIPAGISALGENAFEGVPAVVANIDSKENAAAVANSGAKSITLNISSLSTDAELDLVIGKDAEIDKLIIEGGAKTFNKLTVESYAAATEIKDITFANSTKTPVKLHSASVTLYKTDITNCGYFALKLLNENTALKLSGTNTLTNADGKDKLILCRNVKVSYENSGRLKATGDILCYGKFTDSSNRVSFVDRGKLVPIESEAEFNGYLEDLVYVTDLKIIQAANKTEYYAGDTFSEDGLVAEATYNDGTKEIIQSKDCVFSKPDMNTVGKKTVTVSFNGVNTSFDINVKDLTISINCSTSTASSGYVKFSAEIPCGQVAWSSSDTSVATIDSSGKATFKNKVGSTTITATVTNNDYSKKATKTITISNSSGTKYKETTTSNTSNLLYGTRPEGYRTDLPVATGNIPDYSTNSSDVTNKTTNTSTGKIVESYSNNGIAGYIYYQFNYKSASGADNENKIIYYQEGWRYNLEANASHNYAYYTSYGRQFYSTANYPEHQAQSNWTKYYAIWWAYQDKQAGHTWYVATGIPNNLAASWYRFPLYNYAKTTTTYTYYYYSIA